MNFKDNASSTTVLKSTRAHSTGADTSSVIWTKVKSSVAAMIFVASLSAVIILGTSMFNRDSSSSNRNYNLASSEMSGDMATCDCPDKVTDGDCSNTDFAVLGGLDFVEYFSFDNESMVGSAGDPDIKTEYNGYTYFFKSTANKNLFIKEPSKYAPQFGGFCSWGIAGEFCPTYPWSATCLGPPGNWGVWTIQQGKLFFFYVQTAKDNFMEDVDSNVETGIKRWSEWGVTTTNTNCFFEYAGSTLKSEDLAVVPVPPSTRTLRTS